MTTAYTSLIGLALPVTGELNGTWGDIVNNYISTYVDAAVAGVQTISGTQTSVTLSVTTGSSLTQVGGVSNSGSAQYQIINCTGTPAGTLTITAPASSRQYIIINGTSQSVKIVGTGPTTGVTLIAGEKAHVAWNGTDYVKVASTVITNLTGVLGIANGGTNATATPTAGAVAYGTGTAYAFTPAGTSNQVLISNGASAPSWSNLSSLGVTSFSAGTTGFTPSTGTTGAVTLAGTLATTNGGTGLTSFTANGVVYASSTSALTTGSALTFDGTSIFAAPRVRLGNANRLDWGAGSEYVVGDNGGAMLFGVASAEQMRLTSTGLGIGTSSPAYKLDVNGTINTSDVVRLTYVGGSNSYYLQNAGSVGAGNAVLAFVQAGVAERMRLDSSGNLGLGVTPSAWGSSFKALQFTAGASFAAYTVTNDPSAYVLNNAVYTTDWRYVGTAAATQYQQYQGAHRWYTAPSGTAGNAITFTQAMTLDASGNLGVGTTSPAFRLDLKGSGATSFAQMQDSTAVYKAIYGVDSGGGVEGAVAGALTNHPFILRTNNTERARIDSSGNFGIGTSSPSYKLDVNGVGRVQSRFIVGPATDSSDRMFYVSGTAPTSGASQFGVVINPTLPNTVTSSAFGFYTNLNIASGATVTNAYGLYVDTLSAPSSTITNKWGLYVADTNNNYIGGNLGLGVTPSAWAAPFKAIQIGNGAGFAGRNDTTVAAYMASNYYYNSGDKYIGTGNATLYIQTGGAHTWYTAPSGTAGNAITFTQAMTLDASGNLQVKPGNIYTDATSGIFFTGTVGNFNNGIYGVGTNNVAIAAGGSERARIDSSGNFVLKTGSLQEVKSSIAASNIDLSTGNYFSKTISGTTTFTVSNVPASGTAISFILDLTNGGSATINWWSGTKWAGGTAPTLTSSGRDVLGFFTYDGGTTWTGLVLGKDVK